MAHRAMRRIGAWRVWSRLHIMTAEVGTQRRRRVPLVRRARRSAWRGLRASAEIDIRMFGMLVALAGIWLGFNVLSGGDFLTARNLWNLSVQSSSIAIMATGMVLIIVSRNIDLSVGSILGFVGYTMAMLQTEWIPNTFDLGFDRWYTWIVAVAVGIVLGAVIGAVQGFVVAYVGVPSFIVTLGGILIWRGLIFRYAARPDAGADGRQLPAARWRPARFARRVAKLAARRDRPAR